MWKDIMKLEYSIQVSHGIPPLIDISKLVTLVQGVYPAQVVEYTLGHGKKLSLETEDTDKHKVEETAGLFPLTQTQIK